MSTPSAARTFLGWACIAALSVGLPGPSGSRAQTPAEAARSPAAAADPASAAAESVDWVQESNELIELLSTPVEVWVATKSAAKKEEVPAVVEVVTREDLERWGYRSLAEVLRHTPGFYVVDDHLIPSLAVRGVSGGLFGESGVVKVMIDGRSVSYRSTAGNWLGPELVPLAAVEQIEIVRGPASALYGADAFLGVVNVVTRKGEALRGAALGLGGTWSGSLPGYDGDFAVGAGGESWDVLASLRLQTEDRSGLALPGSSPAPFVPPYNAGRLEAQGLAQASGVGLVKATRRFGTLVELSVSGYLSSLDRGAEFSPWTQLAHGTDPLGRPNENRVSLLQGAVGLNAQLHLTDTLTLTLDSQVFSGGPTRADRIEVGSDFFYVRREMGFRGGQASLEGRWLPHPTLSLVAGAGYDYDDEDLLSALHVLKADSLGLKAGEVLEAHSRRQGQRTFTNLGAWLQAQWLPAAPLPGLIAGVRQDRHNVYGDQTSARLGLVQALGARIHLKALYGSAFKAPSPLLLTAVPLRTGDIVGNPDLKAQRVHTFELQGSWRPLDPLAVESGLAYSLLRNKAEFVQLGLNKVARNVAEVGGLSWETRVSARHPGWGQAYAGFELQQTVRDTGAEGYRGALIGSENEIYPPWQLLAGMQGPLRLLPLEAGLQGRIVGPRRSSDTNTLEHGGAYSLPTYVTLDASLASPKLALFGPHGGETRITLVGRNLLDERGPDPGFSGIDLPLPGRTLLLMVRQGL